MKFFYSEVIWFKALKMNNETKFKALKFRIIEILKRSKIKSQNTNLKVFQINVLKIKKFKTFKYESV